MSFLKEQNNKRNKKNTVTDQAELIQVFLTTEADTDAEVFLQIALQNTTALSWSLFTGYSTRALVSIKQP